MLRQPLPDAFADEEPGNNFPASNHTASFDLSAMFPKQREAYEFLRGPARNMCLVGGSRSGKTALLVRAIIARAHQAPSRHAILRFRANSVWPSIGMDTFPKIMELFFPGIPYTVNLQYQFFGLNNGGSEVWLGGLDDKERVDKILGREYVTILFNECSQISYDAFLTASSRLAQVVPHMEQRAYLDLNPTSKGHWTNKLFGEKVDPIDNRPLANPNDYARMFLNPKSNPLLSEAYIRSLENMPARKRMRFFEGLYHDDSENALWTVEMLASNRVTPAQVPDLVKVVVAVDPSGAGSEDDTGKDAIGIVVVGLGRDGRCYVLADYTCLKGPTGWGRDAVAAYHKHEADCIIAETNFGGAMVEHVIKTTDANVPYHEVKATRGKVVRAEPVSVLYANNKVAHVGHLTELEDELCLAEGTLVATEFGQVPIEQVAVGDRVWTRLGLRKVLASRCTKSIANVLTVRTTRGSFSATPKHLVYLQHRGYVRIDEIQFGDVLQWLDEKQLFMRDSSTPLTEQAYISIQQNGKSSCINRFGARRIRDAAFHGAASFITGTTTRLTTIRAILFALRKSGIGSCIVSLGNRVSVSNAGKHLFRMVRGFISSVLPVVETKPHIADRSAQGHKVFAPFVKRLFVVGDHKVRALMSVPGNYESDVLVYGTSNAVIAESHLPSVPQETRISSFAGNAAPLGLLFRMPFAPFVKRRTQEKTLASKLVPARVVDVFIGKDAVPVYDLTVEEAHEFFANGHLVHNCEFTDLGYIGQRSPNRADALVWAVTNLMLGPSAEGWVQYYQKLAAEAQPAGSPGNPIKAVAGTVTMLSPSPDTGFRLSNGKYYEAQRDCLIPNVLPEDVSLLVQQGCKAV